MRKLVVALLVTTLALGAITLHLVQQLREERAATAALREQLARSKQRPSIAHTTAQPVASPPSTPPAAAPASQPNRAPSAAIATGAPSPQDARRLMLAHRDRQQALLRDPQYREALLMQRMSELRAGYPDLAAELGLSSEEEQRLLRLRAEQELRTSELQQDAPIDGPPQPADMEQWQRRLEAAREDNQREVAEMLGPQRAEAWRDYEATLGVRHQTLQLAATFAMHGAPLNPEQQRAVRESLLEMQQNLRAAYAAHPALGPAAVNDQVAMQEAAIRAHREQQERLRTAFASVLTAEQLALWDEQRDAERRLEEARLRLMRAEAQALEPAAPDPTNAPAGFISVTPGLPPYAAPPPR